MPAADMINAHVLTMRRASENSNVANSFVEDPEQVRQLLDLKNIALGNARLLYGSEQRKFYDVVFGANEEGQYAAVLVCSLDGSTKILRKEVGPSPLSATRAIINGLVKDTGLLFCKYDVGDQMSEQQGYRDHVTWAFELDDSKSAPKDDGPVDATETLRRGFVDRAYPTGPRADRERKRARFD